MISENSFGWGVRVACVVSVLTALCPDSQAATHYISPWDSYPYWPMTPQMAALEVQAVIDSAAEGDEVIVGPGYYRGNIAVKNGINLCGSAGGHVWMTGATPGEPVLTVTWGNVVKGLNIRGSFGDGCGVYAQLGAPPATKGRFTPFRVENCAISSCAGPGILVVAKQQPIEEQGIPYPQPVYDTELALEVSGCEIRECAGGGVVLWVEDLMGKYEGGPGIPVEVGFKHATLVIADTTITTCGENGVTVQTGWYDRAKVEMDRCVVRDGGNNGISVYSGGARGDGAVARVNNSLICGNLLAGIQCVSYDDGAWGPYRVEPFATGRVIARSSTITGNAVGIPGSPIPPGSEGGASIDLFLDNCIVYGNADIDIDLRWFGGYAMLKARNIRHCCTRWQAIGGLRGNINADPLFVAPENGDFTLQPTSPCVDAGALYWPPTVELDDGLTATILLTQGGTLSGIPASPVKGQIWGLSNLQALRGSGFSRLPKT